MSPIRRWGPVAAAFVLVAIFVTWWVWQESHQDVGGGSPAASTSLEAPTPPGFGLTLAEAVEIARAAAPERTANSKAHGYPFQYRDFDEYGVRALDPEPEADAWLWLIRLWDDDSEGTYVLIDLVDGTVLDVIPYIA